MRRDKTATRILLVLSVVGVAVASPAVVRQSLDITEDTTAASEKRANSGASSSGSFSFPLPLKGSTDPETETETDSEKSVNSPEPVSNPSHYLVDPTDIGSDRYYLAPEELDDEHLTSPPLPSSNRHLTTPVSGAPELHSNSPPTSGAPQTQDHTSPMSGNPQLPNDPLAGSEDPQSHDYPFRWWEHTNWRPGGERVEGESSQIELEPPGEPSTASKAPLLQDDLSPALKPPQVKDDSPPASGTPQVPNDPPPTSGTRTSRPPLVHESFNSDDFDSSWRWLNDLRHVEGAPSSSHSESEGPERPEGSGSAAPAVAATTASREIEALKLKLKAYTAFSAILGFGAGIAAGEVIATTQSSGAYVSTLFPRSRPDI